MVTHQAKDPFAWALSKYLKENNGFRSAPDLKVSKCTVDDGFSYQSGDRNLAQGGPKVSSLPPAL